MKNVIDFLRFGVDIFAMLINITKRELRFLINQFKEIFMSDQDLFAKVKQLNEKVDMIGTKLDTLIANGVVVDNSAVLAAVADSKTVIDEIKADCLVIIDNTSEDAA